MLRHQETAQVNFPCAKDLHVGNQYSKALIKENRSMVLHNFVYKREKPGESLGPAAVSSNVRAALRTRRTVIQ